MPWHPCSPPRFQDEIHQRNHEQAHPEEQRCQLQVRPGIKRARSELIRSGREARVQRPRDEPQAALPQRQRTAPLSPHPTDEREHEATDTGEDRWPNRRIHRAPPCHHCGPLGPLGGAERALPALSAPLLSSRYDTTPVMLVYFLPRHTATLSEVGMTRVEAELVSDPAHQLHAGK